MRIVAVFVAVSSLCGVGSAGCIEYQDRVDAGLGDDPEGAITGTITVGDGSGVDPTVQSGSTLGSTVEKEARRALTGTPAAGAPIEPVSRTAHPAQKQQRNWRPGDLIVSFPKGAYDALTVLDAVDAMVERAGVKGVQLEVRRCDALRWCVLTMSDDNGKLLSKERTEEVAHALYAHKLDDVVTVTVNHEMKGFRRPNDDFYNRQWHYQFIHLEPAWDLQVGSDDVVMAVVDSGVVQAHPDLTNRLARQTNGTVVGIDLLTAPEIDDDGDPGGDTNPEDPGDQLFGNRSSYHGTHVSGTMAAQTDNTAGVAGVTWAGKLVPVRVLGRQLSGFEGDIMAGIYWAVGDTNIQGAPVNTKPARIVNLSLGGPIDAASQEFWDQNINAIFTEAQYGDPIIVAAAGNSDESCADVAPANVAGVIGVAAVGTVNGIRAPYSNFGPCVDLMGPGGDNTVDLTQDGQADAVLSTYDTDYDFEQGTSMASPHVAGVAALIVAQNPALTRAQVEQILKDGADDRGKCNEGCGEGWLDALSSLLLAGGEVQPIARLAVDTAQLEFGDGVSARTFRIANTGNAEFEFTASVEGAQASLFSLSSTTGTVPPPDGSTATAGVKTMTVTLNRGALQSGSANVVITTVGLDPEQTATVSLEFNDDPNRVPVLIDKIEVAAYINEGGQLTSVQKTTTTRADHFEYTISGLPRGSYQVFAVGDDNNDGTFDANIESVGAVGGLANPSVIALKDDQQIKGANLFLKPSFISGVIGGVGSPCCTDGNCADERCTFAPDAQCITSFANGYCTRLCEDDGDCGPGASCELLGCDTGDCAVCLLSCLNDAQCRFAEGYICDRFGTCSPEELPDQ